MEYQILKPPPRRRTGWVIAAVVVVAVASGAFLVGWIDRRSPAIRPTNRASFPTVPTRPFAALRI